MDVYEDLRNAIVQQAAEDYASAFMGAEIGNKTPRAMAKECQEFFSSDWYLALTNGAIDAEWLMNNLQIRELERAINAYTAVLEKDSQVILSATVKSKHRGKVRYIFPPVLANEIKLAMKDQLKTMRAVLAEIKSKEVKK